MNRTVGDAHRGQVEVRYADVEERDGRLREELDEVFAQAPDGSCSVHLEKMNESQFALIVETRTERACFMVGAPRARVDASVFWHDQVNRRAEGQRRRWARYRHAAQGRGESTV